MKKIKWALIGFVAVLMMIVSNKVFASDTYTVTLMEQQQVILMKFTKSLVGTYRIVLFQI